VAGLKQLGVVLVVAAMALSAAGQRPFGKPDRRNDPPPKQQPRPHAQQDRPAQTAPPKGLFGGRGLQNPDSRSGPSRRGDWLRKNGDLPPQEQQKALENDPAFRALAPRDQDRLRERLQWFNSLPPERRERVIRRHEIIENMTPDQRARARDLFQRFRNLPESRRKTMDFYFRNLRNMSPEERQRVIDSSEFRSQFSDDEQNIMRGMTDLNLGPGHRDGGEGGPPDD
jgi:hypothetical protein